MAQKLWEKSVQVNKDIERFTVGRDREMDLYLAKHDVLGCLGRKRRICDRRRGGRCTFTGRIDVDPSFGRYRKENT